MDKKIKPFLIISIFLNLFVFGYFIKNRLRISEPKASINEVKKIAYNTNRLEYLNSLKLEKSDYVFIGDSRIQIFELTESFKDLRFKNRGISSETMDGLLKRMSQIITAKPEIIFISCGGNDLLFGRSIKDITKDYINAINQIKTTTPKSRIIINGIFPTNEKGLKSKVLLLSQQKQLNSELANICKHNNVEFIDSFESFRLGDGLKPEYDCGDNVHLSSKGYEYWVSLISKTI